MGDALARGLPAALMVLTAHAVFAQPAAVHALALEARQQGNAMAAALLREDYATVAATACSPVLARVGGALALARQIEVGFGVMQQQGRKLLEMQFGMASAIFDGDATRFALVPYRSVVRVREGRLSVDSYYLGVQDKDADAWCFIDIAALTPDSLRQMYPGAPAGLKLPAPATPVLVPDAPEKAGQ
jgi:hypothetical protein